MKNFNIYEFLSDLTANEFSTDEEDAIRYHWLKDVLNLDPEEFLDLRELITDTMTESEDEGWDTTGAVGKILLDMVETVDKLGWFLHGDEYPIPHYDSIATFDFPQIGEPIANLGPALSEIPQTLFKKKNVSNLKLVVDNTVNA